MQILIADDHGLVREGLGLLLSNMFENIVILEADNVDSALEQIESNNQLDLILLDLQMPGMDQNFEEGSISYTRFAGIQRIVKQAPEIPLVIVSAFSKTEYIVRAIEMGARGYIVKTANHDVLRHALELVLVGQIYVPPEILLTLDSTGRESLTKNTIRKGTPGNILSQLTPRQSATLDLLILGKANKEIARDLSILESTVKAHVRIILKKLNATNRTEAARIAADLGWVSPDRIPE
jgi:DNA-binding NarL/FixJ family response regulator